MSDQRFRLLISTISSNKPIYQVIDPSNIQLVFSSYYQYFIIKVETMGNASSQSIRDHKEHEIDSPHFMLSNCKLVLTEKNRLLKSSWSFVDKKIYQNWKISFVRFLQQLFKSEKYEQITKNPIYDFIFIPQFHEYVQIGYCSANGVVNMAYEAIDDSLVRNIEIRSINNQPFTQSQIWILLYILTKTAQYFHQNNLCVGDIRPENIFIAQNQKFIKIATEHSWLFEKKLKTKLMERQKIFLSEAMIKCLSENEPPSSKIQLSNDNFAIGMTLAQCILLEDLSKIYHTNHDEISIDKDKHTAIIESLLKIKYYPIKLLLVIIGMIQIEQQNRFTSQEVSQCLDEFKVEVLTENAIIIGKAHFKRAFGTKFDKLYQIFSRYKSNQSKKLFINRQLSLSNAYTINGLSTVQMMKRTYDQTFNMQMLDFSSNLSPIVNKAPSPDDNNKSWISTDQKATNFIEKSKRSNVLDEFYLHVKDKKAAKSNQKFKKKPDILRLSPLLDESDVRPIRITPQKQKSDRNITSPIPLINKNVPDQNKQTYLQSPELKIFQAKKEGEQNFSFHSPETYHFESPQASSLNKYKKYFQSREILYLSPEAAESIIISNRPSERPESYITYEYSKSKSNSAQKERFDSIPFQLYFPSEPVIKKTKKQSQIQIEKNPLQHVQKRKSLQLNRQLFDRY